MIPISLPLPTLAVQVTPLMMLGNGLLAFLSPCVLPMLPVYALYLLGGNSDDSEGRPARGLVLRRCLGLALGFVLFFTLMGAGAGLLGNALKQADRGVMNLVSGGLLVFFGLWMMAVFHLPALPHFGSTGLRKPELTGFWGAFAFGLLLVLSWAPCMTPLLANALVLAASAENATMYTGMAHLALFALGLCLPLLAFMLLYQWLKGALTWLKSRQQRLRRIGGLLMVGYGLYLIAATLL